MTDYSVWYQLAPWHAYADGITALRLNGGITRIGAYAFYQCGGITGSLTIPEGVTAIGEGAFYQCEGLTGDLTIPDGVTEIGDDAFFGCSGFSAV